MPNPDCATPGCEHPRRAAIPQGLSGHYCPTCITKQWQKDNWDVFLERQYARIAILRKANRGFVQDLKMTRGCVDCGYAEHPRALQFDHLGSKEFNISKMYLHSRERLLAEIAKCDVVCANCHAVRTARRRGEVRDGQLVH